MVPLNKLYKIITNHKASFDEKIIQLLEIGRNHLGLSEAWIADIDGDQYSIRYALSESPEINVGTTFSLSETFCKNTFSVQGIKASNHVSASKLISTPCYPSFSLETYMGIPLVFNDRPTGILNFGDLTPRDAAFEQAEYEFMVFMSYWIGSEASKNRQMHLLKQQQAQLTRQQSLLDEVGKLARVGTWEMDLIEGKIYWSETTRAIHEVSPDYEPQLDTAINFYKEGDSRERIQMQVNQAMQNGSAFEGEFEIVTATGKVKWVASLGKAEIKNGKCVRLYGGFQDITKQVFYRQELEQGHEELSLALEARSTFLANMSHEIRTPINGVIGSLQVLDRTNLSDNQKHFLNLASQSADALLGQVNDVLDFAKIDANQIALESIPFNINELIESCVRVLEISAKQKSVAVTAELGKTSGTVVIGDPTRVKQICANLISNAVKFTERGQVKVESQLIRQSKSTANLCISVQDTGIGLNESQLSNLFLPFQQADSSTTRRFGGTGLGLSISQKLAKAMEGEITVESELGVGSNFTAKLKVELTHLRESRPPVQPKTSSIIPSSENRVLVVEDNEINQAVVSEMLKLRNIEHDIAFDGLQAVEKVMTLGKNNHSYALILMDCQMPNMDGYQATACIRQLAEPLSEIPIIALTANAMKGDKEKCLKAGMNDYLPKPIGQSSFYSMLDKYLKINLADDANAS